MLVLGTVLISVASCVVRESVAANDQPNLLANGDFQQWHDDRPEGWQLAVGATSQVDKAGLPSVSEVQKAADGTLMLRGHAATSRWLFVSQNVVLSPQKNYRLSFEAKTDNVRREGRQFDNCYIGVTHHSRNGKRLGITIKDLSSQVDWSRDELRFSPPRLTAKTTVMIFLSKSGSLNVRKLVLQEAMPIDPFDELLHAFRRDYSFTEAKKIRWEDLDRRYGAAARAAVSVEEFVDAIEPMLLSLNDMHVWVEMPDRTRRAVFQSRYKPNVDLVALKSRLHSVRQIPGIGFVGLMKSTGNQGNANSSIGVVVVTALPHQGDYGPLIAAIISMKDQQGIVLDLRRNSGGSELRAAEIAGLFTKHPLSYAGSLRRVNGRLVKMPPRLLEPSKPSISDAPVVCLIGPGCVSSGEGLAMMMKAIDGVDLIGQPTRGASGNPAPVTLSNGVSVWFSRWVALELDGTPIEGRGVMPDIQVRHVAGADATLDRAVEHIQIATQ